MNFSRLPKFLILLLLFLGCQNAKPPIAGEIAPDFILTDLSGKSVSLKDYLKGKELILNFWATWCPACREEIPALIGISRKYKDKVEIIAINKRESRETVTAFSHANRIEYVMLLDEDGKVFRLYGIARIPANVLISKEGIIKRMNMDIREMDSYFSGAQ